MPPSPSAPPKAAPPKAGLHRRARWILGGVLLIGVAIYVVANWRRWEFQLWAGAADDPKSGYVDKIRATSDPRLDEVLLDTVKDEKKATSVRRACAQFLVQRNRLREIEDLLQHGTPHEQRIALSALAPEAWFHKQYLPDPAYPVRDVLVAWIGDTSSPPADRAYAMENLLPRVWPRATPAAPSAVPAQALEAVVSVLSSRSEGRDVAVARVVAAKTVVGYRWCAGVPALLEAARSETDTVAAPDLMRQIVALHDFEGDPCASVLPEAAVSSLVESSLARTGEDNRPLRMAALIVLARHPTWATKQADVVRRIFEAAARPEERGAALPALVASGDPAVRNEIASWFHDAQANFRSQAAQTLSAGKAGLEPSEHLSLLVGYFASDPAPGELGFRDVAQRLRTLAGSWIGFPEAGPGERGAASGDMGPLLRDLVAGRTVGGKTRAEIGAAWWNWLAGKNGIAEGAALKAAFEARDAFWAKAKAGDVAGARSALDAAPQKDSPLWEYERGWLAAKAKTKAG